MLFKLATYPCIHIQSPTENVEINELLKVGYHKSFNFPFSLTSFYNFKQFFLQRLDAKTHPIIELLKYYKSNAKRERGFPCFSILQLFQCWFVDYLDKWTWLNICFNNLKHTFLQRLDTKHIQLLNYWNIIKAILREKGGSPAFQFYSYFNFDLLIIWTNEHG